MKHTKATGPGRKKTIIDEPIVPEGDDPFQAALDEFGEEAGIKLQVYRYDPMSGKARYVKSVPFQRELHGLEWLQRMFGAGDYLLRFYRPDGTSRNLSVSVDEDPLRRREPEPSSSGRDELVSLLREQNHLLLSAFVKGAGSSPASATENPVLMKILDAVLPQAFNKPDMSGALLSMLEKGIGIAMEAKTESEGGMAGLIRQVAKELGPVLQDWARAQMARPAGPPGYVPPRPMISPPASAPPPSSPPAPPPRNGGTNPEDLSRSMPDADVARSMVEQTVRIGIPVIERAFHGRERPEAVADWVLGEIPPNYYEHLGSISYERLTELEPRYGQLDRAWVESVLAELRKAAAEGEESEESHGEQNPGNA